jgi:hypothetical protein
MAGQRFGIQPPTFVSTIQRFEKSEIPTLYAGTLKK